MGQQVSYGKLKRRICMANDDLMIRLDEAYATACASGSFKGSKSHIQKAIDALMDDPEGRFRRQFEKTALKNLLAKATRNADGSVPYPSEEDINNEVERLLGNRRAKLA
jgi:hypothetical protein